MIVKLSHSQWWLQLWLYYDDSRKQKLISKKEKYEKKNKKDIHLFQSSFQTVWIFCHKSHARIIIPFRINVSIIYIYI